MTERKNRNKIIKAIDDHPYTFLLASAVLPTVFNLGIELGANSARETWKERSDQRVALVSYLHQYEGSNEALRSTAYDPCDCH